MKQILEDLIALTGYLESDCKTLRESTPITQQWTEVVIDEFYNTLYSHASTAQVFVEGERPHREETLRNWYLEVTSGKIDPAFWEHQWFVGLVHIKRGVDNQFVVGILSRIQEIFLQKCLANFEQAQAEKVFAAFKRITDVIAGLIVEGYRQQYLSAVERISGLSPALLNRMASTEASNMVDDARLAQK